MMGERIQIVESEARVELLSVRKVIGVVEDRRLKPREGTVQESPLSQKERKEALSESSFGER